MWKIMDNGLDIKTGSSWNSRILWQQQEHLVVCVLDRDGDWHLLLATLSTPTLLSSATEMVKLVWQTSLLSTSRHPGPLAISRQRSDCPWAFCEVPGRAGIEWMDKYSTASVGKSLKLVATAFMLPTNLLNVTPKTISSTRTETTWPHFPLHPL